ncbi:MAG: type II secretion system protein [Vicinamibacterales bacterium]
MMRTEERGYAMAALLVALSVMGIMLSVALPSWQTMVQREREAELVFRGEQYVQAIELFSRRNGGFPTSLNALRDGRYIRRLYRDPITNGEFQPVYLGQIAGGVPTVPGQPSQQPGRGATPRGAGGQPQTGGFPSAAGRATQMPPGGGFGQSPAAGGLGQTVPGGGPIIGVSSRSTAQSLRLYNGRNRYNEWAFVSTAATRQAGAPTGGPAPGLGGPPGRGGRGAQPPLGGPGREGRGIGLDGPNRGGPTRGFPNPPSPGPGRAMPFGGPGIPQPFGPGQRGRP